MPISRFPARLAASVLALGVAGAHADSKTDDFFHDIEIDYAGGLQSLLKEGVDPNTRDAKGQVALFVALRGQSLKAAKVLWEAPGIQLDARNGADETPLMMAAMRNEPDAAAALVARGAAVDKDGWTPLHYAAAGSSPAVIRLLLAKGARLEARSPNLTTPLMMAAYNGSEEAVDTLLAAGADRTLVNDQGMDASAYAAKVGRDKLAERLKAPARR